MKRILVLIAIFGAAVILVAQQGRRVRAGARNEVMFTSVPEHPFDVVLSRPGDRSVTATVLAYQDLAAYIEYAGRRSKPLDLKKGTPLPVLLEGLSANTKYTYRLCYRKPGVSGIECSEDYTFHTQRPPGDSFTVTLQADSHLDSNTDPAIYTRTLTNALADEPDFHIDLGDTFMTDKYPAYQDAAAQYLAQRYYFGLLCHSAPLFVALGNHDGEQGRFLNGAAENMAVWSNGMRKRYFPNPEPDGFYSGNENADPVAGLLEDYYAWEWGDALFVVLDPFLYTKSRGGQQDNWGWTLGPNQYRWLQRTLERSKARYKLVFLHHLVGGADSQRGGVEAALFYEWGGANPDGSDGFAVHRPGWAMPIHKLLAKYGVSIVFHGHDHLFARQELDGIVYQEVPQPGFSRYETPHSAKDYGYTDGVILGSPGHLRLRVSPEEIKVDYVRPYLPGAENSSRHNGDIAFSYAFHKK